MPRYQKNMDDYFNPRVEDWLRIGKHKKLIAMLKNRKLSSIVASDGSTLLHLAAKCRNETMTRHFVTEKLNVNAVNNAGETPLMVAVQSHTNFNIRKHLIDAGADLCKIKNNSGQCTLMIVLERNRYCEITFKLVMDAIGKKCQYTVEDIANELISAGFQVYHLNVFKKSEITKMLIEQGCQVNIQDPSNRNNTALHVAATMNDLENVRVLLEHGADKSIENQDLWLPIMAAIDSNNVNVELIELLLPDSKDWLEKDRNMASIFLKCDKNKVVPLLLNRYDGILDLKDIGGGTPLHYLAFNKNISVWHLLENKKVNFEIRSVNKYTTPLHYAVIGGNVEALQFLLNAGANVDALDEGGRSPLFYIHNDNDESEIKVKIVELLMQSGANPQFITDSGNTIISCLAQNKYHSMQEVIITYLAMREASGSILNSTILSHIIKNEFSKKTFATCKQKLDFFKRKGIFDRMTCLQFIINEEKIVWKYIRNDKVFKELSEMKGVDYFDGLLIKRFERAVEIRNFHSIAGQLISKCIPSFNGNHLILEIILDYLDIKDLELIAMCNE